MCQALRYVHMSLLPMKLMAWMGKKDTKFHFTEMKLNWDLKE